MIKISVVGSGVIGLSTAVELALKGYRVEVITRDISEAVSWVAGGMLAPLSEGLEGAVLDFSYESLRLYPEFISRLEDVSGEKVGFWTDGINRVVLEGEDELIKKALEYSKRYAVELDKNPHTSMPYLSGNVMAVIRYKEEAWVDTYSLMQALLKALDRLGVKIVRDSIVRVQRRQDFIERLIGVDGEYGADFYVLCTGAWAKELLDLPIYPVKGQAILLREKPVSRVHYSSVSYIIPRADYTYVGATSERAGFSSAVTAGGVFRLVQGMVKVIPSLEGSEVIGMLAGFRPCTDDELPILHLGENYLFAGGHCRNGILHAPITSRLVLDYVEGGKPSDYINSFSSHRFYRL